MQYILFWIQCLLSNLKYFNCHGFRVLVKPVLLIQISDLLHHHQIEIYLPMFQSTHQLFRHCWKKMTSCKSGTSSLRKPPIMYFPLETSTQKMCNQILVHFFIISTHVMVCFKGTHPWVSSFVMWIIFGFSYLQL